jgi:hypothetical protein
MLGELGGLLKSGRMIEYSLLFATVLYSHPAPKSALLFFNKYINVTQKLLKLSSLCKFNYYALKMYIVQC